MEYCIQQLEKTSEDAALYDEATAARAHLVECLVDLDDEFADEYLSIGDVAQVSAASITAALRRTIISRRAVAVLCGSALHNCAIQPLLDAIVAFLPNPEERQLSAHPFVKHYGNDLCALAFKIVHDRQRGTLTFLRLYAGCLTSGASMFNVGRGCAERCVKLYEVYADEHREVSRVTAGNIIAVSGLKQTVTGDTLVSSLRSAVAASESYRRAHSSADHAADNVSDADTPDALVLAGLEIPDPVFFCSIEPPSLAHQKTLDYALECLVREDPSLRVKLDADTGQTILGGMGELHLDIVRDRILKEYGVEAYFGPLQIAYREAICARAMETMTLDKKLGDSHHLVTVCMSVLPAAEDAFTEASRMASKRPKYHVVPNNESFLAQKPLRRDHAKAVENGIASGLSRGPILGFPVLGVDVQLHDLHVGPGTSLPMVTACVAQCVYQAVKQASPSLMEPLMNIEITVEEHKLGIVLSDLAQRRSQILEVNARQNARIVIARTPLAELRNYATTLRTITSGLASLSMELAYYEQMSKDSECKVVQSMTGSIRP
jgi:elongation factor G